MNFLLRKGFLGLIGLMIFCSVQAQSPKGTVGAWWMIFNQTRISNRISLHSEIQFRNYEVRPNAEQLLPRVGINYHLNPTSFVTAGYAWLPNYAYDKEALPGVRTIENRIWEQYQKNHKWGKTAFNHRFRLEQRWLSFNNITQYKNRARYMMRVSVPLSAAGITPGNWFASFYDEIFMDISNQPFDRNRLYGALGYQFTPLINLQIGYLAQTVKSVTKSYLQLGLNYNLDLRKKVAQ